MVRCVADGMDLGGGVVMQKACVVPDVDGCAGVRGCVSENGCRGTGAREPDKGCRECCDLHTKGVG